MFAERSEEEDEEQWERKGGRIDRAEGWAQRETEREREGAEEKAKE